MVGSPLAREYRNTPISQYPNIQIPQYLNIPPSQYPKIFIFQYPNIPISHVHHTPYIPCTAHRTQYTVHSMASWICRPVETNVVWLCLGVSFFTVQTHLTVGVWSRTSWVRFLIRGALRRAPPFPLRGIKHICSVYIIGLYIGCRQWCSMLSIQDMPNV